MYIKSLVISTPELVIREINFKSGLNLIVDNTPIMPSIPATGNNVGKTTVLKLVDFCFGANQKILFTDPEHKGTQYDLVKNFLIDNKVLITLKLSENINDATAKEITIERNFLAKSKIVRKINGENLSEKEFESRLLTMVFPTQNDDKPTFRQIVSHNIRYRDESITNTLKTLSPYTSDAEYETLYLYLFGCCFQDGEIKQQLLTKLKQELAFKKRLAKGQTQTSYEVLLRNVQDEIDKLNNQKVAFNLSQNIENDLNKLNDIKLQISKENSILSKLKIRKDIIKEAEKELLAGFSNIDVVQLKNIYATATSKIDNIHKTFEELVEYHNNMIAEKIKFIKSDLPFIENEIEKYEMKISNLIKVETSFANSIHLSESFESLEKIINELNNNYKKQGEYETILSQFIESNNNIDNINNELENINNKIFSNTFKDMLLNNINIFNKFFSDISKRLYGETYLLKFDEHEDKSGKLVYKFTSFNANLSSGKKQGEILCFDLAYILFADKLQLPCLHFLLNDKKELMHDNQLIETFNFLKENNIQLIISILNDKLPKQILDEAHVAVSLSQNEKLFKIE